ncbi:MAG TPA: hypothetical protein VGK73_36910 [Polyangiaceae bacterium]
MGESLASGDVQPAAALDPFLLLLAGAAAGFPVQAAAPTQREVAPAVWAPPALVEEVVRRVSWGGDRRRGVARIELGGAFEGTLITVEGEGREVSVELTLPRGSELDGLPGRIAERLSRRGLTLRSFEVR